GVCQEPALRRGGYRFQIDLEPQEGHLAAAAGGFELPKPLDVEDRRVDYDTIGFTSVDDRQQLGKATDDRISLHSGSPLQRVVVHEAENAECRHAAERVANR